MRIESVKTEKLFGVFNHSIDFKKDRITIIHGPNGIGKTILLQMIHGFFNRRMKIFHKIPFSSLRINLDDGAEILIEKLKEKRAEGDIDIVTIKNSKEKDVCRLLPFVGKNLPVMLNFIEQNVPEIIRIGTNQWLSRQTNQVFSPIQLIDNFEGLLSQVFPNRPGDKLPKWILDLPKVLSVYFIKTDRLTGIRQLQQIQGPVPSNGIIPSIVEYSRELATRIDQTLAMSAQISSNMDSTFPNRLIETDLQDHTSSVSEDEIRIELKKVEEKRQRLVTAGLLEKEVSTIQIPSTTLKPLTLNALAIYSKDVQEKLNVFDELLDKIEVFQTILNNRLLFKKFSVAKSKGFIFKNDLGDIPSDSLSSGEQHEIVLFYQLLFRLKPSSLILIDEPEISLHVAWQQEFLNDLINISRVSNIEALIASHSPDIINQRWDLTVELKGE
jgi:predicted ATP-binding protein involved in virulence